MRGSPPAASDAPVVNGPRSQSTGIGAGFLVAMGALALYGLARVFFNFASLRAFGPVYVGEVSPAFSGTNILGIIVASAPAALIGKFVPQYEAEGEPRRARSIFAGTLVLTSALAVVAAGVLVVLWPFEAPRALGTLVPLFSAYLLLRAGYFAFGLRRRYFVAELASGLTFVTALAWGTLGGFSSFTTLSLVLHPATFVALAIFHLRHELVLRGSLAEVRASLGRYASYIGSSLVNAVSGLASYHLVVVFAGLMLPARDTGHLAALLSMVAPFNLAPVALGVVLFPAISRMDGLGDEDGQRRLVARSVLALQLFASFTIGPLLCFPDVALAIAGLPVEPTLILLMAMVFLDGMLSIVSSPCGHFLNASRFVHRQAVLSAASVVGGTVVGLPAIGAFGLIGCGIMRFASIGPLAWARMVEAQRQIRWLDTTNLPFLSSHACFCVLACCVPWLAGRPLAGAAAFGLIGLVNGVQVLRRRAEVAGLLSGIARVRQP